MSTKSTSTRRFAVSSIASGSIVAAVIRQVQIFSDATYVTLLNETTVNNAGGYIQIIGIGFQPGCVVYFNNVLLSSTFISSTVVRATTLAVGNGSYVLLVANSLGTSNNASAIYVLTTSGFPTWSTTAYYSASVTVSVQLVATGDAPLTYSLQSGSSLPAGTTLSSSGLLSGTITGATNGIVYSFVALVDDVDLQTTQATISLTIAFNDAYYKNVTLLLNGETAVTPFIQDASTNNFNLTINGDTRPTPFTPYQTVYYSNYFDGTGDYLSIPHSTSLSWIGAVDGSVEAWVYIPSFAVQYGPNIINKSDISGSSYANYSLSFNNSGNLLGFVGNSGTPGSILATVTSATTVPINTWTHVAFTRRYVGGGAQNEYRVFINGVLQGSTTAANPTDARAGVCAIGATTSGTISPLTGYISNVRFLNNSIPSAYQTTSTTNGTIVFTPPAAPLTAISGTSLLTCQSNRFIDNSLNNFTITKNGDTTVQIFNPFSAPTSVTVNNVYSTYLGGTDGRLTVPAGTAFAYGTGDFTVEGWFLVSDMTASSIRIIFSQTVSGTNYFVMGPQSSGAVLTGKIAFTATASGGGTEILSGSNLFTAGTWNHFAVCRVIGTVIVYLNGLGGTPTVNTTDFSNTSYVPTIGGYTHGTAQNFSGYVSNLRVVKGVAVYTGNFTPATSNLTSTQSVNVNGNPSAAITGAATSLLTCQNSTLIDNSSYVLTITPLGQSQPINSTTPFTQTTTAVALTTLGGTYFDGSGNDYLSIPNSTNFNLGSNDFTIEGWWYPIASSDQNIIAKWWSGGSQWVLQWRVAGYFRFAVNASTTFDFSVTLPLNSWCHFAVVRSGVNLNFYFNGVKNSAAGTIGAVTATTDPTTIGQFANSGTQNLSGYLSNMRVVIGTALYTSNFAPPVEPLTAITNTQLLTLQYNGGANNSGIIDNSAYNNILTRYGNTSQGTFTPFSQTGWSTFFDGTVYPGFSLNYTTSSLNFASGQDFTMELWAFSMSTLADYQLVVLGTYKLAYPSELVLYITNKKGSIFISGGSDTAATEYVSTFPGSVSLPLNQWNHIALVRYNNNLTVYLNGVAGNTVSAPGAAQPASNRWDLAGPYGLWFGIVPVNWTVFGTGAVYTGYMSNCRYVVGTALYTTSFAASIPTTPLTAITNTQVLTHQSNTLINNSGQALTYTYNVSTGTSTPKIQALSPFGSIPQSVPLSYSVLFSGTNGFQTPASSITTLIGTSTLTSTSTFTLECWIYQTQRQSWASYPCMMGDMQLQGSVTGWTFGPTNTGYLQFFWYDGANKAATGNTVIPINTWTHIAVSLNSGAVKLFVNGNQETLSGTTTLTTLSTSQGYLAFGMVNSGGASTGYYGSISNFRIAKTAVYTGTFTVPTSPLQTTQSAGANISAITGVQTSLLTCQSTTMIDNSTNAFTITVVGDTVPRNFNPFGYTAQTNVTYTPSVNGGSIYFDGTGDLLTAPASTNWQFTGDYTLEAWIYVTSLADGTIFGTGGSGSADQLTYTSTGSLYFASVGTATGLITTNTWIHVAVSRSGTTQKIFLNGALKLTSTISGTIGQNLTACIGRRSDGYNAVTGYISNLRIIKGVAIYTNPFITPTTPLTTYSNTTPAVLLLNSTSGGIIDYHSSNVLETVGNAQLNTNIKLFGNASMSFDGTGDYLSSPANPGFDFRTGDFTIELWIYAPSGILNSNDTVISKGPVGVVDNSSWSFQGSDSSAGNLSFFGPSSAIYATTTTQPWLTGWTHLAMCRSGSNSRCFVNGVQVGSTYTTLTDFLAGGPLIVGSSYYDPPGRSFNGYIEDVRLTKGFARYTANFNTSPPISPATTFLTQ